MTEVSAYLKSASVFSPEVLFALGAALIIIAAGWLISLILQGQRSPQNLRNPQKIIAVFAGIAGEHNTRFSSSIATNLKWEFLSYRKSLGLRFKVLRRRFPMEKDHWNSLISNLPDSGEELLGSRKFDLLVWGEPGPSNNTFKLKVKRLSGMLAQKDASGFALQAMSGVPLTATRQYAPFLSAYILAQFWPEFERQGLNTRPDLNKLRKKFALRLNELLVHVSADLAFDLIYLDGWVKFQFGVKTRNAQFLKEAAASFETAMANWPDGRTRFEYAQLWTNLACARFHIGVLTQNVEMLEQSLDASDAALAVHSRERAPWQWASLHDLRASIFSAIGKLYNDASRLEEAANAVRSALIVWRKDESLFYWAKARKKLADILRAIGTRAAGTHHLTQAISVYRSICKLKPLDIPAELQVECLTALGEVEGLVSEREGQADRLQQAVQYLQNAYALAGEARLKEQTPHIRVALGQALTRLANFENESSLLTTAIGHLRIPPQDFLREETEFWIKARHALARALLAFGTARHNRAAIEEAEEILRPLLRPLYDGRAGQRKYEIASDMADICSELNAVWAAADKLDEAEYYVQIALEGYRDEAGLYKYAMLQRKLAKLLVISAKQQTENSDEKFEKAISAYRQALKSLRKDDFPLFWSRIQNELGTALSSFAAVGGGTPRLEQAAQAYCKALDNFSLESVPYERAETLNNLGNVLADLGTREKEPRRFSDAIESYSQAYDIYASKSANDLANLVQDNLRRAQVAESNLTTG